MCSSDLAVKFIPHGSIRVDVQHLPPSAEAAPQRPRRASGADGWVRIAVQDTGVGISSEQMETIFGEFVQLPQPESNRPEGTGLGLSIASRIADLLGGDLTVQSEVGVQSTFTLYLPCPEPVFDAPAA